jgi:hypothetical protein
LLLGPLRLGLSVALGLAALLLDPLLAFLRGDFGLEPLALELGLLLLLRQLRLVLALLGRAGLLGGVRRGVGLCVLEATLTGQVRIAGHSAGGFLRLARDLSDDPAGDAL